MSENVSDHTLQSCGCDIPEHAPLSEVLSSLSARTSKRWSAWGLVLRRWGSASLARAWMLGLGLVAAYSLALLGTLGTFFFVGGYGAGFAGVGPALAAVTDVVGPMMQIAIGIGALGLAFLAANCAVWVGIEFPIRLWTRFSLSAAGKSMPSSGLANHCFAPWNTWGLFAIVCCIQALPALFFLGGFETRAAIEQAAASELKITKDRLIVAAQEQAARQVGALAHGDISKLSDEGVAKTERPVFWSKAVEAWADEIAAVVNEQAQLSSPEQTLVKNEGSLSKSRLRLAGLDQERAKLINGYWATLGLDKEAQKLEFMRLVGKDFNGVKVPERPYSLTFCLPMPSPEQNTWMAKRGLFSPEAKRVMAVYLNAQSRFDGSDSLFFQCDSIGRNRVHQTLLTFGDYLEHETVVVKSLVDPSQVEFEAHYFIRPSAWHWAG